MRKGKIIPVLFYAAGASMFFCCTCSAYIDPAATSYIIQIAAGVIVALGAVFGIMWSKLRRAFKKKKYDNEPMQSSGEESTVSSDGKDFVTAEELLGEADKSKEE